MSSAASPADSPPGGASGAFRFAVPAALMAAALVLGWFEVRTFAAKVLHRRALAAADRPGVPAGSALAAAREALAMDPAHAPSLYLAAVQLKRLGRWSEIEAMLPRLTVLHPNQAAAWRLAGESSFVAGRHAEAADRLGRALAINPEPPSSPANVWRMRMMAAARAGRGAEALACALRVCELAGRDPSLDAAGRRDALLDASDVLRAEGLPETAGRLSVLAGAETASPQNRTGPGTR